MRPHLLPLTSLWLLAACIPVPDTNNPLAVDDDKDGFTELEGDCDDTDPTSDLWRWYADEDGDGQFGGEPVVSCVQPPRSGVVARDCDDTDPLTFEGAATEAPDACMRDADGDGFGDAAPTGAGVATGTDCNDLNAYIFPGAASAEPELCTVDVDGDGWGADTNGGSDCDDQSAATRPGAATREPEACTVDVDGDGWGDARKGGTDCDDFDSALSPEDADGDGYTLCDADCDDSAPNLHPFVDLDGAERCGWRYLAQPSSQDTALCAIDSDGTVSCWGRADSGGASTWRESALGRLNAAGPHTQVEYSDGYAFYAVHDDTTLARYFLWGAEYDEEYGPSFDKLKSTQRAYALYGHHATTGWMLGTASAWLNANAIRVFSTMERDNGGGSSYLTCGVDPSGGIRCDSTPPASFTPPTGSFIALELAKLDWSDRPWGCAIAGAVGATQGALTCFGRVPSGVPAVPDATAIATSLYTVCTLDSRGQPRCSTSGYASEARPPAGVTFRKIVGSVQSPYFCGITTEGGLRCWGEAPEWLAELF
jgi:hypothetical protein